MTETESRLSELKADLSDPSGSQNTIDAGISQGKKELTALRDRCENLEARTLQYTRNESKKVPNVGIIRPSL